jgi:hypothetical protein
MRESSRPSPPRTKKTKVPLLRPTSKAHSQVPSDPHARFAAVNRQRQIAELVRLGTINSKNLWIICGATAFNSEVAMKAQAAIQAKTGSDAIASTDAAAREFA